MCVCMYVLNYLPGQLDSEIPHLKRRSKFAVTLSYITFSFPASQYGVYVVVQFYPWFKFYFLVFKLQPITKTKEIKFEPRIKI